MMGHTPGPWSESRDEIESIRKHAAILLQMIDNGDDMDDVATALQEIETTLRLIVDGEPLA